ncbi:MAG: hypothetical protein FWG40_00630 [Peptococcaceae bacterium]|nr:hypothetical protein [Peptococcaceae bacterium]
MYVRSTQNQAANSSTVYLGMYVSLSSGNIGAWSDVYGSSLGVAGASPTSRAINGAIPYTAGPYWIAEEQSFVVPHDHSGAKTITVSWKWGVNSSWGGYVNPSGSFSQALPTIQRTPATPTGLTHTRVSDSQNNLSWTYTNTSNPYGTALVERSINGHAWTQIASLSTNSAVTSYSDTSCVTNCSYSYRVRADFYGNKSGYSNTSAATYNTPMAPGTPTAARVDADTVRLTFTNMGATQTATEWRVSTNGTTWWPATAISGANITTIDTSPGGGTFYYQVRNTRGSLYSAWSGTSNAVVTIVAPAAPTLTAPASGSVVKLTEGIRFAWQHNPIDGSQQEDAELRYSTNNGSTWTTVAISGSSQTYAMVNGFAVNASVVWQVRTKGAHANYGVWSASFSFKVCQVPQISIITPVSPITDVPIAGAFSYSDISGTMVSAVVSLITDGGSEAYRKTGNATNFSITSAEFLPENLQTYTLRIEVRSSSSLTAIAEIPLYIDYTPPPLPDYQIDIDEDTGSAALLVIAGDPGVDTAIEPLVVRMDGENQVFISFHFYETTANSSWITSSNLEGQNVTGSPGPFYLNVPEGAKYFRVSAAKRVAGTDQEITEDDLESFVLVYGDETYPGPWVIGTISASTGGNSSATNRLRMPTPIAIPTGKTAAVGIYRRHADGRLVLLLDQAPSGSGFKDLYPPLDQDFEYVFVAYTATGVTSRLAVPVNIPSYGAAFFNFGQNYRSVAAVVLDLAYTETVKHSSDIFPTASDDPAPLIFYGSSDEYNGTVSGTAFRDNFLDVPECCSIRDIKDLSSYRGYVIMRLPWEDPLPVDVTVSQSYYLYGQRSNVSVNWVRVMADGLAI